MSKEEEVLRIQNKLEAKDDLIRSPQSMNFALQKYFGTILIYQFFELMELHLQRGMHLITAALRDIDNTME